MNLQYLDIPLQKRKIVQKWLWIGVVMVLGQIVLGGITRLTNSGLSITEWNIITGTIPPLNQHEWNIAFSQYKEFASKQYYSIHGDMNLPQFKKIFFWEYFHRLWARIMFFVFIIPFPFFLIRKYFNKLLLRKLAVVITLAALAAIFGIIMVRSGLSDDKRTWVSAYKLVVHLALGTALFAYLFWTTISIVPEKINFVENQGLKNMSKILFTILVIQIVFGGLMAGMRAGLIFPYLSVFSKIDLFNDLWSNELTYNSIIAYESDVKIKLIVQIFHRIIAYLLTGFAMLYLYKAKQIQALKTANICLLVMLLVQMTLGLLTVVNCIGSVPILLGALHQSGALILLSIVLFHNYKLQQIK